MRGAGKHGNVPTLVATMPACYTRTWRERSVPEEQMGTLQPPRASILKHGSRKGVCSGFKELTHVRVPQSLVGPFIINTKFDCTQVAH